MFDIIEYNNEKKCNPLYSLIIHDNNVYQTIIKRALQERIFFSKTFTKIRIYSFDITNDPFLPFLKKPGKFIVICFPVKITNVGIEIQTKNKSKYFIINTLTIQINIKNKELKAQIYDYSNILYWDAKASSLILINKESDLTSNDSKKRNISKVFNLNNHLFEFEPYLNPLFKNKQDLYKLIEQILLKHNILFYARNNRIGIKTRGIELLQIGYNLGIGFIQANYFIGAINVTQSYQDLETLILKYVKRKGSDNVNP